MATSSVEHSDTHLVLESATAGELMTPNPVTVPGHVSALKVAALLTDEGISGVLVVDGQDRAIGVLTRTDLVRYFREYCERVRLLKREGLSCEEGFLADCIDETPVSAIMVPIIGKVDASTPAAKVVDKMLTQKMHRLFVTNEEEEVIGIITTMDILRRLRPPGIGSSEDATTSCTTDPAP